MGEFTFSAHPRESGGERSNLGGRWKNTPLTAAEAGIQGHNQHRSPPRKAVRRTACFARLCGGPGRFVTESELVFLDSRLRGNERRVWGHAGEMFAGMSGVG